ncbi:MAG: tetratricopeptide repeat protein [Rhodothermales bacterium]
MEPPSSDQWQQVEALLDVVLDLPPEARRAHLEEACGRDPALRDEVLSLIAAYEQAPDFLEEPVEDFGAWAAQAWVGRTLGPYRLIRPLGQGGMGAVLLAERADGQFQQEVAVKLARRDAASPAMLRRFRHERQILASLTHPNIARLYDGGVTEEGLPYLVMEYVRGVPVDRYCDAHRLALKERLQLFQVVCRAVQFAHRNLIVHRDLKPSNILVTDDGEVKLLDFGIARLLNPDFPLDVEALTRTGQYVMTPEYAAPEQVRGEAVTTATDVYALGVILYELLTGHRPYRFESRLPQDVERVVCEQPPEKPSTAVSRETVRMQTGTTRPVAQEAVSRARSMPVEKLRRRLQGDLDNIVLMALRKEPERRYSSADQFLDDIKRYLAGMPVLARKDTLGYRAHKFVRRHRWGIGVAVLVVLSLAVGLAGTAWQAANVAEERDRVRLEAAKAEQVKDFLVDLFEVSNPEATRGDTITVREVLDRASQRIEEELDGQPEVQAEMMATVGNVYQKLGLYDASRMFLAQALDIRRRLHGREHEEVAETLYDLAELDRANRHFSAAEPLYQEALVIYRKRLGDDHLDVAKSLVGLAITLRDLGKADSAEVLVRQALTIHRAHLADDDPLLIRTLGALAFILRRKGVHDESETLYREVLIRQRTLLDAGHPDLIPTLNNLAYLLRLKEHYAEAESLYREALAIHRAVYGEGHPRTLMIMGNLAGALRDQKKYAETEAILRERVALARKHYPGHWRLGSALSRVLGKFLMESSAYAAAEPLLREGLAIYTHALGENHEWTAAARSLLGTCLMELGQYDEAERLLTKSYPLLRDALGDDHDWTREAREALVRLYTAWGKPEKAAAYRASAVEE